jgi:hypothetical protein
VARIRVDEETLVRSSRPIVPRDKCRVMGTCHTVSARRGEGGGCTKAWRPEWTERSMTCDRVAGVSDSSHCRVMVITCEWPGKMQLQAGGRGGGEGGSYLWTAQKQDGVRSVRVGALDARDPSGQRLAGTRLQAADQWHVAVVSHLEDG